MKDVNIDAASGTLRIISCGWSFAPGLRLAEFQASEAGKSAQQISKISNHYQIRVNDEGWLCGLVLMFGAESIQGILLGFSETEMTWADWKKDKEERRKKVHDNFLRAQLGPPPYLYPWGRVVSALDPHDSTARIVIHYGR
jgi:hypothetical protein